MILPRGALSRGECTQGSPNAPAPFAAVSCGQHPGGSVAGARRQRPTHCPTAARCEDCRGGTSVLRRPDRVASRAPVFLGSSRVSNAGALAETSRHGGPPWVRASADVVLDVSLAAKAAKAFARRGRSELWPANIAAAPSFRSHWGCETCEWCRDSWAWTLMGVDRLRTYEGMIIGIPGVSPRPVCTRQDGLAWREPPGGSRLGVADRTLGGVSPPCLSPIGARRVGSWRARCLAAERPKSRSRGDGSHACSGAWGQQPYCESCGGCSPVISGRAPPRVLCGGARNEGEVVGFSCIKYDNMIAGW